MASVCDRADDAMLHLYQRCTEMTSEQREKRLQKESEHREILRFVPGARNHKPVEKVVNFLFRSHRDPLARSRNSLEEAVYPLQKRVEGFQNEFRCLRIFLDCIHRWSDLEDVLHMGSLASMLEAKIQEIANKLINNIVLAKYSIILKASKLGDLFSGLMSEVMYLKLEIRKACDSLTSHSFQFIFDYYRWKEFRQFVKCYAEACNKQCEHYDRDLNERFRGFNSNLLSVADFLDCLTESSSVGSKTKDAMIHVGRVAISAALGLCECWAMQMNHFDKHESMLASLLPEIWLIKLDIFLRGQLNTDQNHQMPVEEKINALNQELQNLCHEGWLKFLKTQIEKSTEGYIRKLNRSLKHMEEAGKVVQSLDQFIHAEEITIGKDTVRNELFKLILLIVLFKADLVLLNIHNKNNNQSLMAFDNKQIEALHKGLDMLIMFVKSQPAGAVVEAKLEFAHIQEVAYQVSSFCHSLPTNKITEEEIKNMNLLVSDLLEKTRLVTVELTDIYLHIPRHFPKTNGLGFFSSLLEKLRELLKTDLAASMKHQIDEILEDLKFLTPFLKGILEQAIEFQEAKDVSERIIDVAYKVEYCIDSMLLEDSVEWHISLWLYNLQEDIILMRTLVTTISNEASRAKGQDMHQTSAHKEPKATTSRIGDTVVILNDQEEMIIDRLLWGTPWLGIVPIVGMPGIGKTTLAKQVYNSPRVVPHFQIRTWCCISQVYRKREVLLEILSHITALGDDILGMSDEDLDFKLRKLLLKNRFLIVMDDMWNTQALDDLKASLPNDGNGSRILLTSRHNQVALKANPPSDPHFLRQLSDTESWNLLEKKIFHQEICPEELRHIGEQIAKSCKGLPLAIVAVSGILEKTDRQYDTWKGIADDLSFYIVDHPEAQCRKILELSYKHLPDSLKACFLYFGAFLEDQDIPARKLMQLWISEGFVRKTEFKSLENIAEEYLMDLISRSLVVFSQRRSRGGAKTCRVHDVLQKFCQSKAKEDKFLMVITGSGEYNVSLDDLGYVVHTNFSNSSSFITCEDHRLSLSKQFIESRPSGPHVRSLICFATNDKDPKRPYDMSFISHNFRFLKTLDLECINMGTSFPTGIERLLHLRYLAVAGYIDSVPSSIAKFKNLETFIVKGLKGQVNLPNTIWCLKRLRHLHVSDLAIIILQDDQHGNSSRLDCLVSISSLFLHFGEETEHILRQFSNLRKLKCIFSDSWNTSQDCNNFPTLDVLNQLESLKISYYGLSLHPGELSFPLNLKKLTLSKFRLPWNKISVIGHLPNLEVLKLLSRAFVGESWDMKEGEFPELKYLKLDTLDIAKWNACSDHLPKLEQLVLRCCQHLEEVPSSFVEIPTLQTIDIQWCGNCLEESVRQIKDEGDEKLKVFINFAELDFSST